MTNLTTIRGSVVQFRTFMLGQPTLETKLRLIVGVGLLSLAWFCAWFSIREMDSLARDLDALCRDQIIRASDHTVETAPGLAADFPSAQLKRVINTRRVRLTTAAAIASIVAWYCLNMVIRFLLLKPRAARAEGVGAA